MENKLGRQKRYLAATVNWERQLLLGIYTMIRNPHLWSVFQLILSLKSSKLQIFSLKTLIFELKYIGFQERNCDIW